MIYFWSGEPSSYYLEWKNFRLSTTVVCTLTSTILTIWYYIKSLCKTHYDYSDLGFVHLHYVWNKYCIDSLIWEYMVTDQLDVIISLK